MLGRLLFHFQDIPFTGISNVHSPSIAHKAFGPGSVQMNDSEESLCPLSARTNIFTYVTFVCKEKDVRNVFKPTGRSYQVENPLNEPKNISVTVNRWLAQIEAEGEQRLH